MSGVGVHMARLLGARAKTAAVIGVSVLLSMIALRTAPTIGPSSRLSQTDEAPDGVQWPQTDVMEYLDVLPNKRARIARVDVATDFPFYMAFPDEKTDPVVGASWGMDFWNKHHYELIGPQSYILRQPSFGCRTASGARRWFIQAGGHMGPYPMAGAMYGCKAVSIDGNKVWQSYIEASAKLSGVADRVQALHAVAGPKSGEHLSFGSFEVTRSSEPSENSVRGRPHGWPADAHQHMLARA